MPSTPVSRAASQHGLTRAGKMLGKAQHRRWGKDRFEQPFALDQRHLAEVVAIQIQQVEGEIHDRPRARQVCDRIGIGLRDARLNQFEARHALFIERGDLAIQNGLVRGDVVRDHAQFGVLLFAGMAGAGDQPDGFAIDEADGPHAVPFDLEQPFVAARRRVGQGRFHGRDRRWAWALPRRPSARRDQPGVFFYAAERLACA